MHHSSGKLVSGRVDDSSKSAMTDPLSERPKSWSKYPVSAEVVVAAEVVGPPAVGRGSYCGIGGGLAILSRLSASAVMPSA